MKLELKHLAGYLPYGLKAKGYWGIREIKSLEKEKENHYYATFHEKENRKEQIWTLRPILRPLSDLTKEIELNGEKFVPIDYFEIGDDSNDSVEYGYGNVKLIGLLKDMAKHNFIDLKYMNYGVVEKLQQWHLDIHGLIENGLAIDINTIEK